MRIAFDLDDTLFPSQADFPCDPTPISARPLVRERLRMGARSLLLGLLRRGHQLGVYTSSLRSRAAIRWTFLVRGIPLGAVITAQDHGLAMRQTDPAIRSCSKYPPAFGFDVLVDDRDGVAWEGRRLGFRVIVVRPDDPDWARRVLDGIAAIEAAQARSPEVGASR